MTSRLQGNKSGGVTSPLKVTREMVEHLPPIYRAFAEYLIKQGDPAIALVEEGS